MLSKTTTAAKKKTVDLRKKPDMSEIQPYDPKKEPARGPMIYVHDVDLPITTKDIGKKISVKAILIPREVSMRTTNGKTKQSYDLEVAEIQFNA